MVYKPSIVEVDLLLLCSGREDDATKLQRTLIGDYPASNHLMQANLVQSYPDRTYTVHGIAKIALRKLDKYRSYLKRIKTPGGLKFKDVQVEVLKE